MKRYWPSAFIFADMNSFFAGVEQMDDPALRGKPVAVTNGLAGTCIITCSYEARAYGIKTGTRLKEAYKLCPDLIRKPSRPERYVQISTRIMKTMEQFTPELEVFSVDEVFLDVTDSQHLLGDPPTIANKVKDAIYRASGVKASIGVTDSKFVAKWAAKLNKPDGLTIIEPGTAKTRLENVPVTDICGINKGIANHLAQYNAFTCGDVARLPMSILAERWGTIGKRLHLICSGYDPEPIIKTVNAPKSIGHGKNIPPNTTDRRVIETYLLHMSFKVASRLRLHGYLSRNFYIGIKTQSEWCAAKYQTLPTNRMMDIYELCIELIEKKWRHRGVSQVQITALDLKKQGQLDLFTCEDNKLDRIVDNINMRFGELAIAPVKLLNRSSMPNVIAPSWKPYGHREALFNNKYNTSSPTNRTIPFYGYIS